MIALIDVDDTIADLVPVWLECYDNDYRHKIDKGDIKHWDITKYVIPECGKKIYDYLKKDGLNLYYAIDPIVGALDGVNHIKDKGWRVVFVTAFDFRDYKFNWLVKNGFTDSRTNYVIAPDKSITRGDLLIDDNVDNVCRRLEGDQFLFTQPWNSLYKVHYSNMFRVNNWKEVIATFDERYALT
jgi:5'(3')-deoxyribonucleotidase